MTRTKATKTKKGKKPKQWKVWAIFLNNTSKEQEGEKAKGTRYFETEKRAIKYVEQRAHLIEHANIYHRPSNALQHTYHHGKGWEA